MHRFLSKVITTIVLHRATCLTSFATSPRVAEEPFSTFRRLWNSMSIAGRSNELILSVQAYIQNASFDDFRNSV